MSTQVLNHGSWFMILIYELVIPFFQVYNDRSKFMIQIHELEFWERQVHKYGSKVMIHAHELEVFGHTSLQEWITNFDPHS